MTGRPLASQGSDSGPVSPRTNHADGVAPLQPCRGALVWSIVAALLMVFVSGCAWDGTRRGEPTVVPVPRQLGADEPSASTLSQQWQGFWATPGEGTGTEEPAPPAGSYLDGLTVNPLYRATSAWFFENFYRPYEDTEMAWSGDHTECDAGSSSQTLRDAVLQRVNYFRGMAGVPSNVRLSLEYSAGAQQAALMMSVNGRLSHWPDESWSCYSVEGDEAAGNSLLLLGATAWHAVDGYVEDRGAVNEFVPHRRMLLYPHTKTMGTGDIPRTADRWAANALWVLGEMSVERPETRDGFVAWPPPGYVPYQVIFPRWSLSYDQADFTDATVVMALDGSEVPLSVLPVVDGFGENTIVWEPEMPVGTRPEADLWYSVQVQNVQIGSRTHHFSYVVIVFDPDS